MDSKLVNDGIHNRCARGDLADFWIPLWYQVKHRNLQVTSSWVRSHVERKPADIIKFSFTIHDIVGNSYADTLAERGADLAELPAEVVKPHQAFVTLVTRIQERLIAILSFIVCNFPRPPAVKKVRILPISAPLSRFVLFFQAQTLHQA